MSIPSCGREMSNIMRQFVDVLFCHRLSTILFSKKFTSFCTVHTTNLCLNMYNQDEMFSFQSHLSFRSNT